MPARRPTPPAARALCRELRRQGKSIRQIVAAAAQLGHVVTRSAVGRIVGPQVKPRPRRAAPSPAARLDALLLRLAEGNAAGALALAEDAAARLRQGSPSTATAA